MEFPTIKVTCKCGNEWLIVLAPWEVSWDEWGNTTCSKCNSSPESYIWNGMVDQFN